MQTRGGRFGVSGLGGASLMAKMFYSLAEAAEKLGKKADDVRAMIESGELQEFRSGDELVVKREQVDLLVGDDATDDTGVNEILGSGESAIDLAADTGFNDDSLGVIGLSDSVVDDDSPIVDTGNDDSLVIGLEESSMGGSFTAVPADPESLTDESAGGSVALTDSVTDAISMTGDTTAGSTGGGSDADLLSGVMDLAPNEDSGDASRAGSGIISLASESGSNLPLGMDMPDSKEQTGISIFDDGLDDDDASAATIVTTDATAPDMSTPDFDAGASGSGLLDLTREGDDTSLGVDLIGGVAGSAAGVDAGIVPEEGALFETPEAAEGDIASAVPMAAFAEAYDGAGSGLVGGLALGIVLSMLFTGALTVLWMLGGTGSLLFDQLGGLPWFTPVAAIAGITVLVSIVAWVLGRRG